MTDHTPNPTRMSDALRPIVEQCLKSTRRRLDAARVAVDAAQMPEDLAARQSTVTMYENRVAALEELLR